MEKKTIFILLLLLSSSINARVWTSSNEWSQDWELSYQEWITSDEVSPKMFVDKNSPYYGISADCADAAYALRAIFSFENSLPFAIKSPTGSRNGRGRVLSNNSSKFDERGDENKRLVALINYIADLVGSENLTRSDTYSVAIRSINPGTLFTYKIKMRRSKSVRHVYTIKEVSEFGTFDLIYATQAIRAKKLPMEYRKNKALINRPHDAWGFKRFIWPRHLLLKDPSSYPRTYYYSREQFKLASTMKAGEFFKYVKDQLKKSNEDVESILKRSLQSICNEARGRIKNVNQGFQYRSKINGRCMNYREYDTYSTPARDKALRGVFELFFNEASTIDLGDVSQKYADLILTLTSYSTASDSMKDGLLEFCPINYRPDKTIDLGELYRRQEMGLLSSHPNDLLSQRWGETKNGRTKCSQHYKKKKRSSSFFNWF